jgi:hypothetical protein
MRFTRSAMAAAALAALSLGATTALASPASAAPNTTPQNVCGSGYATVNSTDVDSAATGFLGTVYLTYNASNGQNCVATIRNNPGTAMDMSAWIDVPDTGESSSDFGQFTSYAGPTYVYGKGYCVDWGGNIDNVHVAVFDSNCGALKEHRVTSIR